MKNSIREVHQEVRSLSAALAEVWFTVVADHVTPTTEVRGRVVGPRCPGHTTIEVAYPLQRISHSPEALMLRVVIPEPSLWEAQTPFLYRAHVELWQDGERCDEKEFDLGLRTRA
jgi:hypothetical protein